MTIHILDIKITYNKIQMIKYQENFAKNIKLYNYSMHTTEIYTQEW